MIYQLGRDQKESVNLATAMIGNMHWFCLRFDGEWFGLNSGAVLTLLMFPGYLSLRLQPVSQAFLWLADETAQTEEPTFGCQ